MRRTALLCLALTGCFSTDYVGRDPRKVYVTMKDGMRGYTKGGEFHSELGFGGGLLEVVGDHPGAERAASTFRNRMIAGFAATMVGTLCLPTVMLYDLGRVSQDDSYDFPVSHGYLLIGCLALTGIGAVTLGSAMSYQLDAINIYNDAIDASQVQWPPAPAPRLPAGPPGNY